MHDSEDLACCAECASAVTTDDVIESLELLDAAYSLEIQKHRLLIAREKQRRVESSSVVDFVIRHRRAA